MQNAVSEKLSEAFSGLLPWYYRHQRSMPWRTDPTPYRVWISEIMLQQTRVDTVIPYFERFLGAFPDIESLAAADLGSILKLWEGLGYYSRARNLHRAAQLVFTRAGGLLPESAAELESLPGFGPYTAAAVASIAFGEPVPVVDANVLRVAARIWAIADDIGKIKVHKSVASRLSPLIRLSGDPSAFNQGLMELGATICLPVRPQCSDCPLESACIARGTGRITLFPVKARGGLVPRYKVHVAVIQKNGKFLLQQRLEDGLLGGMWEWPGGRVADNHEPGFGLAERIHEQTGIWINVTEKIAVIKHAYSHFRITVYAYTGTFIGGRLRVRGLGALRWVGPGQILSLPMGKAAHELLDKVIGK